MRKKSILLISITVIFLLFSPFMKQTVIDMELRDIREWMMLPFWALGAIAAVLLAVISMVDTKTDFIRNATNKYSGFLLSLPGFWALSIFTNPNQYADRFPLFGTITEFIFGVLMTLFAVALIEWSVLFFLNHKKGENTQQKWSDFFNLKFKDLIWLAVPFVLGCLDSWIVRLARTLREHMMSFMPIMTAEPPVIPVYVRIFASEVVPSILYLIICTAMFMFLCNYEKINKAVAISAIILCVFGVLRYYLRLFNFSGNLINKLLLGGLPISSVLLSMPLAVSIKSLLKSKQHSP